jgi:hypothetical protein
MLAGDIATRKKENDQAQHTIDAHLTECKLADRVLPYSDKTFKKAAIQWLVSTDQVCYLWFASQLYTNFLLNTIFAASFGA